LLEDIKDAEDELNFLSEYEELLECDLEETKQGGVYGNILERIQEQIVKAENVIDMLEKSTDEEADSQDDQA
jgi:flagellar biosynthesis chaperone FliJ